MKDYEKMSDHEKAVANRDRALAEQSAQGSLPGIPEVIPVQVDPLDPGIREPSIRELAVAIVSLENALRNLAEVQDKNAKAVEESFLNMGRHVSELEGKIEAFDKKEPVIEKSMDMGHPDAGTNS